MKFVNPLEIMVPGHSLVPAQRAAATYNGTSVNRGRARTALVSLVVGSCPSGSTIDVTLQGKNLSTGSWEAVKQEDGSTDLTFAQRTNSAAGNLYGNLNIAGLPYDEFRTVAVVVGASGAAFSTSIHCFDFPEFPPEGQVANAWKSVHGPSGRAAIRNP